MHGTYVDKEKLQKRVPCQLVSGSTVEFGADVYRNSGKFSCMLYLCSCSKLFQLMRKHTETFHSRRYAVAIRPWAPSPGRTNAHGIFKVPDGESSEEESYGSSRMDESDDESDSSAPEVHPLQKASSIMRSISIRLPVSLASNLTFLDSSQSPIEDLDPTEDMVPDSVDQNAQKCLSEVEEPQGFEDPLETDAHNAAQLNSQSATHGSTNRLRTPLAKQRSRTPVEYNEPAENSENGGERSFSPTFGLVTLSDDAPSVGYPEIPDSVSVVSFSNSSVSDEYPYPLDAADIASHGNERARSADRSISPSSASSSYSEDGMGEDQDLDQIVDPVATASAKVASEKPQAVVSKYSPADVIMAGRLDPSTLYIMGETSRIGPNISLPPIAAGGNSKERGQLVQPMSLDRILDGDSKEKSMPSNIYVPSFTRPASGARADGVSVESLLNLTSEAPNREWKDPVSHFHSHMTTAASSSKQQVTDEKINHAWPPVPFDSLVDGPSIVASEYRQGPFAPSYRGNSIFAADSTLPAFEIPDMDADTQACYFPPSYVSGRELEKSKTSISISDIVDKQPTPSSPTGKKRKLKELDQSTLVEIERMDKPAQTSEQESSGLLPPNDLHDREASERHPKRKRLHTGSALLGAALGGLGVFAALAFLPESLFQ
jgi:hypothetical protein